MKKFFIIIALCCLSISAQASHIIGGEIGYKHVSGLDYEVNVNLYGDCAGSAYQSLFDPAAFAQVDIYNGNSFYTTIYCSRTGDYGKEITPVCDADSNNTRCRGGNLPGISEFRFTQTLTLPTTSANWRFVFAGDLVGVTAAGRTNQITNAQVLIGNNYTLIYLIARLNNTNGGNSTPVLTTVPTPFFCVNQLQQYNLGAADADNDSLHFVLTDALYEGASGVQALTYNAPYSGAQPLAASSFSVNGQNGQLTFVPNQSQTSLIVNRIDEYRNGLFVGSMMREMNFIVLNNCTNQSPNAQLGAVSAGDQVSPTEIEICNADSAVSFSISAYDPDSGNVNATLTGVPNGMNYTITNNNTPNPKIDVNFTFPQPMVGGTNYDFFVSFQDDNCPISSKTQVAYTVKVVDPITLLPTAISESCIPGNDGIINVTASSTNPGGVQYSFNGGPYNSLNTYTGLSSGSYPIVVQDSKLCKAYTTVFVDTAVKISIDNITATDISCFGLRNGKIAVSTTPPAQNTSFTLYPTLQVNATGRFENLAEGNYVIVANASQGCTDTASVTLSSPPAIEFNNINITTNWCNLKTGRIDINSNILIPATYSISPNQQTNNTGSFGGLIAGYYIITVKDTNGCYKDTILQVTDEPFNFWLEFSKQDVSCVGDGNDGWAAVKVNGGIQPYTYFWETYPAAVGTGSRIDNQRSGLKRVFVTDALGCKLDGYTIIEPANCCEKVFVPSAFTPNGDGQNEVFRLRTPLTMNDVKFIIMNRWGQKVWQTNNQLDGWDGNYSNGEPANVGTYYYFLKYRCDKDASNTFYKKKGDINLIR